MKNKTILQIIIISILAIILGVLIYFTLSDSNNMNMPNDGGAPGMPGENNSSSNVETKGSVTVSETKTLNDSYSSETADESVIKVEEGGNLTLEGATITKSGDSSNTENSEFYGVNAAVLTTANATTTITDTTINTSAKGANAVFSTGENSKVYIKDSTIVSTGSSSARGLDSTYGGYIEADNVNISTIGGSCATLATDRGEGTVIAKNSVLSTAGKGSPLIYSTGNITLEDSEGTATGSQFVVVEGKNTATVTNSNLKASGIGNRGTTDKCGVMIYQSMSGDASEGTGTFNATNSTFEILSDSEVYSSAPFFFITNTDAIINLKSCTLKYGSGILLSAKGTSEWGNSGNNAGNVILNAISQKLEGNIEVDNISTATINLKEGSKYTGTINSTNTAKTIKLVLDSSSTITLTGNSYVTSLEDSDASYSNINFNGYTLYVNGTAINK